jgi:hypothetical protein
MGLCSPWRYRIPFGAGDEAAAVGLMPQADHPPPLLQRKDARSSRCLYSSSRSISLNSHNSLER